jgi:hypothetical protein
MPWVGVAGQIDSAVNKPLPGVPEVEPAPVTADADANDATNPQNIADDQARRRAAVLAQGRRGTFLTGPNGTLGSGSAFAAQQLLGS